MAALDAKASTSKENAGARVSPSKTIYSSPSLSTSGFLSDNDLSPPWDQGWQLFIPASIQDGPSRFGFIENALAEGNEDRLLETEDKCKSLVNECPEGSDERRWLVRQLVEVRLKIQEKRDDDGSPKATVRLVLGHHMQLQENDLSNIKMQCDRCCASIWTMIHSWYKCKDCDFVCHTRCLSQVTRACVHVAVSERPEFELRICPEVGLASDQKFKCAECNSSIIFNGNFYILICPPAIPPMVTCFGGFVSTAEQSWSEPRLCDYSGYYFCPVCHWNTNAIIPARVVHNWDFEPRKVSRAAQQLLKLMADKPILVLKDINHRLFGLIEELSVVQGLREDLIQMKRYLSTCDEAISEHFMWQLGNRQHLIENAHTYSLQDLVDIYSGIMLPFINQIHETFAKHIKTDCKKCSGQGFYCELCNSKIVFFPFDPEAFTCPTCLFAFHSSCWVMRDKAECPRCLRLQERHRLQTSTLEEEF